MDKKRMGEIAILLFKQRASEDMRLSGISNPSDVKKSIGELSQKIGIPREELLEFLKEIGKEILTSANEKLQSISFVK